LIARTQQLGQASQAPGGNLLEQGRALLSRGSFGEAAAIADRLLAEHPSSPLAPEARYLAHLARLEQAMVLANVERPGSDPARAGQILEALTGEPHDFAVTAEKIMRATRASARVTIGYSGGTVELEKEDGRWIAKRLVNQWIT
jgi:hypothetical protein